VRRGEYFAWLRLMMAREMEEKNFVPGSKIETISITEVNLGLDHNPKHTLRYFN
jgi:hypothetical protein